jgi:RNA polymerase sigma-70 factor, ECF subfamily
MSLRLSLPTIFSPSATETDFEAVYHAELPRIYNFFRYRLGDGPLAEDLTATTFEKAWRHRHQYRRDLAAFSTWLFIIARRVAADYYRQHQPPTSLETLTDLASDLNTETAVQQRADFARLQQLLSRLTDRDRELVALKYGAGLTNRAIARITNLSESNVGTIIHRVVQSLRDAWENQP